MRKATSILLLSLIVFSCEKSDLAPDNEFNLDGNGVVLLKLIYSSSSDNDPYAFNAYYYDEDWNVTKILISNYPSPVFASYTYEYSENGKLLKWRIFV